MDETKVHGKHVLADHQLGEAGEGDRGSLRVHHNPKLHLFHIGKHHSQLVKISTLLHVHHFDNIAELVSQVVNLLLCLKLKHVKKPELFEVREDLGNETNGSLVGVEVAHVLKAVMAKLDGEHLDKVILFKVNSQESY